MTGINETLRPTFPIGVVVCVVQKGKLLLGKRLNVHGNGGWGLPGGHLELGEKMEQAARRELFEETGLTAKRMLFKTLINNKKRSDDRHYIHVGFCAEEVVGVPENREPEKCSEWCWFPLDALPTPLYFPHEIVIRAYREGLMFLDEP